MLKLKPPFILAVLLTGTAVAPPALVNSALS
jgi:hypothetical protein